MIDEIDPDQPYFGARRMSKHLVACGIVTGGKGVSRYYRMMAIEAVYPKMNLTKPNQAHKLYPYLVKAVEITTINQLCGSDISYIRTDGFVYLIAIIDWFSSYILSCKVSISLDSDFCIAATRRSYRTIRSSGDF